MTRRATVAALFLAQFSTFLALTPCQALTPEARARHVAVYDPDRQRMILCGGDNGTTAFADVWALSLTPGAPPSWSKLKVRFVGTAVLFPRGAAAVFDSRRHVVYIHGGATVANAVDNHLLRFQFPTSDSVVISGLSSIGDIPSGRMFHSMVYDSLTDKAYVFGGTSNGTDRLGDTYVMSPGVDPDTRQWSRITTTPSPSPRFGYIGFLDTWGRRFLVMGGDGSDSQWLPPFWALSLDGTPAWTQLSAPGYTPTNLIFAASMFKRIDGFFQNHGKTYINGGWLPPGYPGECWQIYIHENPPGGISEFGWERECGVGAGPGYPTHYIYQHTAVYDPLGDRMIRFGGATIALGAPYLIAPTSVVNETWQWTLPNATQEGVWTRILAN